MSDEGGRVLGRRVGAFVIDWLVAGLFDSMIWIPWIMMPTVRGGIDVEEIRRNLIVTFIAFLYLLVRDVMGGRGVGKRCLGLEVVTRRKPSLAAGLWRHVLRNIPLFIFPLEAIWLVSTSGISRFGDKLAGTTVVRRKE